MSDRKELNNNDNDSNIEPNLLDNVLSNLFNNVNPEMMGTISKLAEKMLQTKDSSSIYENVNDKDSHKDDKYNEDEYVDDDDDEIDLDLYLLDESGGNICDNLITINSNLTKLNDTLEKLTVFFIESRKKDRIL